MQRLLAAGLLLVLASTAAESVFSRHNLVAWCIVPFDAGQRGPLARARLLKRLGITRHAYDWRDKDIPTFDAEADPLAPNGVKMHAFWLTSGTKPQEEKNVRTVPDFLARRSPGTEIRYMFSPPRDFGELSEEAKVEMTSGAVGYLADARRGFHSKVGLHNHGGWFGEPENQIAIIRKLQAQNIGMVGTFHHGRPHLDRFPALFAAMRPYLLAVNRNGMKADAPMILPRGEGDREREMLRVIRDSGDAGPIDILNHRTEVDAEAGLRQNLAGLRGILEEMGDREALRTYR